MAGRIKWFAARIPIVRRLVREPAAEKSAGEISPKMSLSDFLTAKRKAKGGTWKKNDFVTYVVTKEGLVERRIRAGNEILISVFKGGATGTTLIEQRREKIEQA